MKKDMVKNKYISLDFIFEIFKYKLKFNVDIGNLLRKKQVN